VLLLSSRSTSSAEVTVVPLDEESEMLLYSPEL